MASLSSDIETLARAAATAIAANDGATALSKARQALALSIPWSDEVQHGGERMRRQLYVQSIKELLAEAKQMVAASAASSAAGVVRQPVRYVEPTT